MKLFVAIGGMLAGLGVVTGAFGAHALESILTDEQISTFQIGVRYQMIHALAIIAVGLLIAHQPGSMIYYSGWCFIIGIFLFSGSIYLLTLTGEKWLGMITPVGGLIFIAGWILLVSHVLFGK